MSANDRNQAAERQLNKWQLVIRGRRAAQELRQIMQVQECVTLVIFLFRVILHILPVSFARGGRGTRQQQGRRREG